MPASLWLPPDPWNLWALVLGLIVGSFANVCIHRLPIGESVVGPASRCPHCRERIRPRDNVPILSYVVLGGRCRHCRAPISPRYPAIEAANGLLYWALAWTAGFGLRTFVWMGFATALLVLVVVDLDHQVLPDAITLPGVVAGLAASLLPGWSTPWRDALIGAVGGYLALALVAKVYRKARGIEGLGQGDWKMAAMLGAFLGWQKLLLTVFLATFAGTLVGLALMAFAGKTGRHALPLGTFLGAAGLLVLFAGEPLLAWYEGLFGV